MVDTWRCWRICKGEGEGVVLDEFGVEKEKKRTKFWLSGGRKLQPNL
jgi:hypothetical protein